MWKQEGVHRSWVGLPIDLHSISQLRIQRAVILHVLTSESVKGTD